MLRLHKTNRATRVCPREVLNMKYNSSRISCARTDISIILLRNILQMELINLGWHKSQKTILLQIPSNGGAASDRIDRRLQKVVTTTFQAANLPNIYTAIPLIRIGGKEILPTLIISKSIYQLSCFCGTSFIDQTSKWRSTPQRGLAIPLGKTLWVQFSII